MSDCGHSDYEHCCADCCRAPSPSPSSAPRGEPFEEVAARAVRTALDVIEHASKILDSIDIAAAPEHDLRNVCDRLATHLAMAPGLIEYAATTNGNPVPPQGERERALEEALRKAKLELEFRYAQIEDCEGALTPEGWRDYQARRTARATASSPHYAEKGD